MASHAPPVAGSARLWRWLTEPSPSVVDPPQRQRAQLLAGLLIGYIVVGTGYGLWFLTQINSASGVRSDARLLMTTAAVAILCVAYWLSRGPHWRPAALIFVGVANLLTLVAILVIPNSPLDTAWLLVGLLVCSLLLSARASAVLLAFVCAITFVLPRFVDTPSWFGGRDAELLLITVGSLIVTLALERERDLSRLAQQARALAERDTALRASEERYRSLATELNDGIYVCDARGVITYANPALARMLGLQHPEQAVGQHLTKFVAPDMVDEVVRAFRRRVEGTRPRDAMTVKILRADEANVTVEVNSGLVMEGDRVVGMRGILHDVTARERAEREIRRLNDELERRVSTRTAQLEASNKQNVALAHQTVALAEHDAASTRIATTDALTGLANRRRFHEALEESVSFARRHHTALAVVSLDLDGLKAVNDSAGHEAGDAVLVDFAALLAALCRVEDLPARLGGDEFSVLLPGIELDGAMGLAERVLAAVRSCTDLAERGVTTSAGVAALRPDELPNGLLRRADEALYAAKRGGGDAVAAHD